MHLLDTDNSEPTELPRSSNVQSMILHMDRNRNAAPTDLSVWTTPLVPKNTQKNIVWVVTNFENWRNAYNLHESTEPCPSGVLERISDAPLILVLLP